MSAKIDLAAKLVLNAQPNQILLTCCHFSASCLRLPTYKIGKMIMIL